MQKAVLNSKKKGVWGVEEKQGLMTLEPGKQCDVAIMCDDDDFKVSVGYLSYILYRYLV